MRMAELKAALSSSRLSMDGPLVLGAGLESASAHSAQVIQSLRVSRQTEWADFREFADLMMRIVPGLKIECAVEGHTNTLKAAVCMTPRMHERLDRYHDIVFLGSVAL
jgi:hypothetical protein